MNHKSSVSIVIPAWNSVNQLKQNLPSVFKAAEAIGAEVIVVDDASSDNTLAYLKSLGTQIHLYSNPTNLGFAQTVNRGVGRAQGDVVVLLNTDVRPSPDCFTHLAKSFQDTKLFSVTFNSGSGWAKGVWERGLFHHLRQVPKNAKMSDLSASIFASGGQAAFDKNKWLELGGMDPLYAPFYWEDVDLGYRAWKHGWHIVWDPRYRVVHDHHESVISGAFSPAKISGTAQRNQLLFIWKNIHDRSLIISHLKNLPRFIKNYPKSFFTALLRLPLALHGRKIEKRSSVRTDHKVLSNWA